MVTRLQPDSATSMLSPLPFSLAHENDTGNVEYKLQILPSPTRFTRLVTQLNWRLVEGMGTCYYGLGVMDDGSLLGVSVDDMRRSVENLCAMAHHCDATVTLRWLATVSNGGVHVITEHHEAAKLLCQEPQDSALCIELNHVPEALNGTGVLNDSSSTSSEASGSPDTRSGYAGNYDESQSGRLARLIAGNEEHLLSVVSSCVDLYATDRLVAEVCVARDRDLYIDYVL